MEEMQEKRTEETQERVLDLVERDADGRAYVTLQDGRRLQIQGVPPYLLTRLEEAYPDPPMPRVRVPVPDEPEHFEEEPNPNDPDWLVACEAVRQRKNQASIDLALIKGVIVEVPSDDGWLEDLDCLGIPRPPVETASQRRLAYLRYEVLKSAEDLQAVAQAVYALTMPSEGGITRAAARFQRPVPRA